MVDINTFSTFNHSIVVGNQPNSQSTTDVTALLTMLLREITSVFLLHKLAIINQAYVAQEDD